MGNDTDTEAQAVDYLGDILGYLKDIHGELIAIRDALEADRS